jgi:hypothetical protein
MLCVVSSEDLLFECLRPILTRPAKRPRFAGFILSICAHELDHNIHARMDARN